MSNSILEVRGIGQSTATVLARHGIKSATDLARTTIEQLSAVQGFSASRSTQVISDAQAMLATQDSEITESKIQIEKPKKVKKDKKTKKPKKSKQKDVQKKTAKKDKSKEKSQAKSKKKSKKKK